MTSTIRKVLISSHGDPSVVSVISAPIDAPAADEVQVKVLYAGMGGADIQMRQGTYPSQRKAPLNPGYTMVGRVHMNGPGASKFKVGDLVGCLTVYDAEAEYCNQPEKYLVPVPEGVDHRQAVAMILDWTTAYGMVYRVAKVQKGQRVFIHGLSGAVGHAIFDLCKLEGAEIYGTAAQSKHAALREEGATPFVYSNKDWMTEMNNLGGAQVVFDPLGFESWDESWKILAPKGGHLIGYGGNFNLLNGEEPRSQIPSIGKLLARNLVPFCPQKTSFYYIGRDQSTFEPELKALFELLRQGKIQAPIKKEWNLEDVPEAHKQWNQSSGVGSVVVKCSDDVKA